MAGRPPGSQEDVKQDCPLQVSKGTCLADTLVLDVNSRNDEMINFCHFDPLVHSRCFAMAALGNGATPIRCWALARRLG